MVQLTTSSLTKKVKSMIPRERHALTQAQKDHFLEYGFVKLSRCFSRADAAKWTGDVWTRLGCTSDPSTWTQERIYLPETGPRVRVAQFAPKAWAAICELLGGDERISDDWSRSWGDGFIMNCGRPEYRADDELDFRTLDNWHVDGDFFIHFLDSPEQALLVVPLFSDVVPKGGGTVICTDGIGVVAKYMYAHPKGLLPSMRPQTMPETEGFNRDDVLITPSLRRDEAFYELTGTVGDVYLLHPLMLHSASRNLLRTPRIITNPPVSLKEPFQLSRPDGKYSLVEKKTLLALGMPEGLGDWKIARQRRNIVPERIERRGREEREREREGERERERVTLEMGF